MNNVEKSRITIGMSARRLILLGLISLILSACCREEQENVIPTPRTEAKASVDATEVLESMVSLFETIPEVQFEVFVTYEVVQENGQTLHFDQTHLLLFGRPDRLNFTTVRDNGTMNFSWIEDGSYTLYKLPENIYGRIDGPSTVSEMVDVLTYDYNLDIPFYDVLSGRSREVFLETEEPPWYVGPAWVQGEWAHHIALRKKSVDMEVWIRETGDPVLLKTTINWRNQAGSPSYSALFSNWDLAPQFTESSFRFVEPPDAERIDIIKSARTE